MTVFKDSLQTAILTTEEYFKTPKHTCGKPIFSFQVNHGTTKEAASPPEDYLHRIRLVNKWWVYILGPLIQKTIN